jgi:tripeptide aminopeptidase
MRSMEIGFLTGLRRLISAAARVILGKPKPVHERLGKAEISSYVNRIVSDAILFNEIPSPTERETLRTAFILQRLTDFGCPDPATDEHGNVVVVLPASEPTDGSVLLFSEIRNEAYSPLESLVKLEKDRVTGNGIAENSIGVAALLVLAEYIVKNDVRFSKNLTMLFSIFDPGERDVQPLERFLKEQRQRPEFAVNVRGLELGRISDRPLGTYKLTVGIKTPEREVDSREPAVSAISVLAGVAHRLGGIRWDGQDETFLNIARMEAGVGFGWYASEGTLEIEIFSRDRNALEVAKNAVCATVTGLSAETGAVVDIGIKVFIPAANAEINARLNAILKGVHEGFKLRSKPSPLPDHAAFINSLEIPAVSIGITTGRKSNAGEYADIRPIEIGFRQLIAFLEGSLGVGKAQSK